jgi:FtsP/CotA-like multicopper oxidase with cupredoxin domain
LQGELAKSGDLPTVLLDTRPSAPDAVPDPGHQRRGAPAAHAGWNIVVVPARMGTARIIAKFSDYTGLYVLHCHNLEQDMAMMARYDVVP